MAGHLQTTENRHRAGGREGGRTLQTGDGIGVKSVDNQRWLPQSQPPLLEWVHIYIY